MFHGSAAHAPIYILLFYLKILMQSFLL